MFRTRNNNRTLPGKSGRPALNRLVGRIPLFLLAAGFCCLAETSCTSSKPVAARQSYRQVYSVKDSTLLEQRADSLFYSAVRSIILGDYRTAITQFSDYLRLKRN